VDYPYKTVQMYDTETDSWTIEGDAPFLRANFSAEVVNNKIYVIGGTDRPHPCIATSTVYELTINPRLPDFNGDGIINAGDMCIMID
jgi:N-acetylneuraminic acid mutarotase